MTKPEAAPDNSAAKGWRVCIDHIIRPDSPCPVCALEASEQRLSGKAQVVANYDIENDRLEALLTASQARVKQLEATIEEVGDLINESSGVDGLHLNGDIAEWDWLLVEWLPILAEALQQESSK
jgi:hypothetical protein